MRVGSELLDLARAADARSIFVVGIGRDVGKTTALRAIYDAASAARRRIGLASIGREGDPTRTDEIRPKPRLWLQPQTIFVSARGSLPRTPAVEILKLSRLHSPAGALLYARAAASAFYELVGPPTASGVREVVDELCSLAETVIVDGAVDRVASLAGSDGAVIVACGAAAAKTIEEAVDETAALVARLRVPRLDAQAPVIELQGALTASQAAEIHRGARKASDRRPRSDADRSERKGRIACSGPTTGSVPPPVARHSRDDRVDWARAQLRTASLCNCHRKGDGFAGLRRLRRHARRVKALELLDPASAHVLGFEWLKKTVAPISPYGERHFSELRPFVAGEEAEAEKRAKEIASVSLGCTQRTSTRCAARSAIYPMCPAQSRGPRWATFSTI